MNRSKSLFDVNAAGTEGLQSECGVFQSNSWFPLSICSSNGEGDFH